MGFITSRLGGWVVMGLMFAMAVGVAIYKDKQVLRITSESAEKIAEANGATREAVRANVVTQETLTKVQEDYEAILISSTRLQEQYSFIESERDEIQSSFNSYRGRWSNVAMRRPTLLSRMANRATAGVVRDLRAATCRVSCDADGVRGDPSESAEPSEPDSTGGIQ